MRKEAKLFVICLFIIFLNFPIVLLLYFFAPNMMEKIFLILVPLESILMGIALIKMGYDFNKNEIKECEVCVGTIKKFQFILVNDSWIKAPIIQYIVKNKEYLKPANMGYKGIMNNFLINKKVKVYYDKNNPDKMYVKNPVIMVVGFLFIIIGIITLFLC